MRQSSAAEGVGAQALVVTARLILAAVFGRALVLKLINPAGIAAYIASAGFPAPTILLWLAIAFELALVLGLLTGFYFRTACIAASIYVLFLAFAFHGPGRWVDPREFDQFVSHFPFIAGLMFATLYGPGDIMVAVPTAGKRKGLPA